MIDLNILYKDVLYPVEEVLLEHFKNQTYVIHLFFDKNSDFINNYEFDKDNIIYLEYNKKMMKIEITLIRQLGYISNLKATHICYLVVLEGEFSNGFK